MRNPLRTEKLEEENKHHLQSEYQFLTPGNNADWEKSLR